MLLQTARPAMTCLHLISTMGQGPELPTADSNGRLSQRGAEINAGGGQKGTCSTTATFAARRKQAKNSLIAWFQWKPQARANSRRKMGNGAYVIGADTHLSATQGLMEHDAGVWERASLSGLARRKKQRSHGGRLAHAERADGAADVLQAQAG